MRLAVITDVHGRLEHAGALKEKGRGADALVVCGDWTTFCGREHIQAAADALRLDGAPCFFVLGNCDAAPPDEALEGCENLHGRVVEHGGWLFAGVSGSLPCPSHTPGEQPEEAYARLLENFGRSCAGRAGRLILVSHQPPYGTAADLLPSGLHVGCHALRAFIDEFQPACCLTGHIHEAASRSAVGRTVVLNPGPFSRGHVEVLEL
jgi:Icc-related predicted phosphoesterase